MDPDDPKLITIYNKGNIFAWPLKIGTLNLESLQTVPGVFQDTKDECQRRNFYLSFFPSSTLKQSSITLIH